MRTLNSKAKIKRGMKRYQRKRTLTLATMGNESGVVSVPGAPEYVYVQPHGRGGTMIVANLGEVQPLTGLPVVIGEDDLNPGVSQVLGIRYWPGATYPEGCNVGKHAATHLRGGSDPVYIDIRQIINLLLFPVTGFQLQLYPGFAASAAGNIVRTEGALIDLTAYQAVSGLKYVAVGLDSTGTVVVTDGVEIWPSQFTWADLPAFGPTIIPIAWVRMYPGQTKISDSYTTPDILDARWLTRPLSLATVNDLAVIDEAQDLLWTEHLTGGL